MKALIVYYTKTGHTKKAAEDIARGLTGEGVDCTVEAASRKLGKEAPGYDILVVGTPTYGNRMYKKPAKQLEEFIVSIPLEGIEGKTAGVFTVQAGYGGKKVVAAVERILKAYGAKVAEGGPVVTAGAPLSLWPGPDASDEDVKKCEEFGRRLAGAS